MNERVIAPRAAARTGAEPARKAPALALAAGGPAQHVSPSPPRVLGGEGGGAHGAARGRQARRVLLVDGDPIARLAVREALSDGGRFAIVGEAGSAREAIRIAAERCPQLVVMGAGLPDSDCPRVIAEMVRRDPCVRVLILSAQPDEALWLEVLRAGAWGCLPKATEMRTLRRALIRMVDGEVVVTRAFTTCLVESLRGQPDAWRPLRSRLTTREWEVVDLLSAGASTDAIAEHLVVSHTTVYTHVNRILRKLGVHSRAEAIAAARRLRGEEAAAAA